MEVILNAIVLTTAVFASILCTWTYLYSCSRGFDITDEGISYLMMRYPKEVRCYPFFDYIYSSILFRWCRFDIKRQRQLTLLFSTIAVVHFSWEFLNFMGFVSPRDNDNLLKVTLVLVLYIANCLRFTFGPAGIWYNHINSWCLLMQAGFMLYSLRGLTEPNAGEGYWLYSCFAGVLVGIQFFVKISCALISFPLLVMSALIGAGSLGTGLVAAFSVVLGVLLWLGVHFGGMQTVADWSNCFRNQLVFAKEFRWGRVSLPRYAREVFEISRRTGAFYLRPLIYVFICGIASIGFEGPEVLKNMLIVVGLIIGTAEWLIQSIASECFKAGTKFLYEGRPIVFYGGAIALLGIVSLCLGFDSIFNGGVGSSTSWAITLGAALLFVLPFVGAFGTGNAIFVNTIFQISPWFALLYLATDLIGASMSATWLSAVILECLILFASFQTVFGMLCAPYRVLPIKEQQHATAIGDPKCILKLDEASHIFFNQLSECLKTHGFKRGDDILGFFDIPGIVYAVGGVSPGHQWFYRNGFKDDTMREFNRVNLARVNRERVKRAFIFETGDLGPFESDLRSLGLRFPDAYLLCGVGVLPHSEKSFRVWRPIAEATEVRLGEVLRELSSRVSEGKKQVRH